jgi:hypothetical protein
LLENPEFLAEGGTLGFGLRHVYLNDEEPSNIYGMLKASTLSFIGVLVHLD